MKKKKKENTNYKAEISSYVTGILAIIIAGYNCRLVPLLLCVRVWLLAVLITTVSKASYYCDFGIIIASIFTMKNQRIPQPAGSGRSGRFALNKHI